jgi:hypothetical protein
MPDYGTKSGSGVGARSTYRGGSGYTTRSQASKSRSKASERRLKAAKKAKARAEKALADQKARDAANKTSFGQQATANVQAAQQAAVQEAARQAAQQAAARQAAASRSGAQTGRGAAGQKPVTGGRGRTVERPGERAAAIARQRAAQTSRSIPRIKPQPKPEGMSLSRAKAGLYNLLPEFLRTDNRSGRTAKQQAFHDSIHGADARRDRRRRNKARRDQVADNVDTTETTTETTSTTELPPEVTTPVMPPVMPPQFPQYPGMSGGLGAFGYSPASLMFESQQGAGQVPYYMAAARNQFNPNLSPAFQYAAQNYDILGGMQRVMPHPIEMMSARERSQIMDMGSNFSVPNYNSPYDQFDFFRNLVGGRGSGRPLMDMFPEGPPPRFGGPGKGAPRPMSQGQARAMGGGLGSLMRSGMMGMF